MKKIIFVLIISIIAVGGSYAQKAGEHADITTARHARDRAGIEDLQKLAAKTRREAEQKEDFEAYLRLAQIQVWLCEAIESRQDDKLFKQAAEEGIAAAEKAVKLRPDSSTAHYLLGDLLTQLIPHVYGGGMRYGQRANDELDKAIQLDPKNVDALVSRSISYYYTPESFGGGKAKAIDMLKNAVKIDPNIDSPHIWLAMFYLDAGQKKEASTEILMAQKINPERGFTKTMVQQITGAKTTK